MTHRSDSQNEDPRVRDGRRRELRELLVTAANAARATRQNATSALEATTPRAVRERMTVFFAAAR